MRIRKMDANGDKVRTGRGLADFWVDVPDAVAQLVSTRLALWQHDWFLNWPDGTPYATMVLGKRTEATRDAIIQARILSTTGVLGIKTYSSSFDRERRVWSVNGSIDTIYGGPAQFAAGGGRQVPVFRGR
jgi:hypothetical protein